MALKRLPASTQNSFWSLQAAALSLLSIHDLVSVQLGGTALKILPAAILTLLWSLQVATLSLLSMQDMVSVQLGSTALKRLSVAPHTLLLKFAGYIYFTLEYAGNITKDWL